MSRVGKTPVSIPDGVTVSVEKRNIAVKGPKGELNFKISQNISVEVVDNEVIVTRSAEHKTVRAMHGTTRNLINNMIIGVSQGYKKELELVGVGYRVAAQGKDLKLSLGLSHPVIFKDVEGVTLKVEGQNKIIVEGIDKHLVGQVAANIRANRPPEPYKGKGIKYSDERIIKKAGKAGKAE